MKARLRLGARNALAAAYDAIQAAGEYLDQEDAEKNDKTLSDLGEIQDALSKVQRALNLQEKHS